MKHQTRQWQRVINAIRCAPTLHAEDRDFVADLLILVWRGQDPRDFAGTKPPRARPNSIRDDIWLHYFLVRRKFAREFSRGKELTCRKHVADKWGYSDDHVARIWRKGGPLFAQMRDNPELGPPANHQDFKLWQAVGIATGIEQFQDIGIEENVLRSLEAEARMTPRMKKQRN